jgi:predicted TIM-barrel fold metal-dependent hydrolase
MLRVDAHYHASVKWWEPVEVFLFHMDRCHVDKGVLVQFTGEFDNAYLVECSRRFPERLAAIGLVDLTGPAVEHDMEHWFAEGVAGFRMPLPVTATLQEPLTGWRKAEALGAVVSVVGTTAQFASLEFESAVRSVPGLPVIIEHMAVVNRLVTAGHGADNDNPQPPYEEYRRVLELGRYPNVYIKVTGFAEYMPRPGHFFSRAFDLSQAPPFIDMCVEAFGADHMMVGTDPSSSCREGYANVWADLQEYLTRFSPGQQAAILGETADRIFGFGR